MAADIDLAMRAWSGKMLPHYAILGFAAFGLAFPVCAQQSSAPAPAAPKAAPASPAGTSSNYVPPKPIPAEVMKHWPRYPEASRAANHGGIVLLRVALSSEGVPLDVSLAKSSSFPELDVAAAVAVKDWRFSPAMRNGEAVDSIVNVPVNFSLKDAEQPAPATAAAPAAKPDKPAAKAEKPAAPKKPKVAQKKPAPKAAEEEATPEPAGAEAPAE
jgi:TonB family protein